MAKEQTFSIKEAIKFGWHTTLKNFWLLFSVLLVTNAIGSVPQIFRVNEKHATMPELSVFIVMSILIGIINLGMSYGMTKIFLALVDKKKATFNELFKYFQVKRLWKYFLACILYSLTMIGGYILLIIPGIYFGIKYAFVPYLVIDKNMHIKEAFSMSAKMTDGLKWKLIGFYIVGGLVTIAGFLVFILGAFVTVPAVYLAQMYVYRKLYKEVTA